jgi:glucokinase
LVLKKTIGGYNLNKLQIGFAMPGPFDYEKGISWLNGNAKYETLYGYDLKLLLAEHLGVYKENIYFINDAAAFGRCC